MSPDSSDSDNEFLEYLKEAQDCELFNNSLYKDKTEVLLDSRTTGEKTSTLVSVLIKKENQFNRSNITPEFGEHVSRKLFNLLEKKLASSYKVVTNVKNIKNQTKTGIKLLSDSKKFIKLKKTKNYLTNKLRFKQRYVELSTDDFHEISLTGQYILSQQELKHWSKRSKSQVFHYKEKVDGQLILLD